MRVEIAWSKPSNLPTVLGRAAPEETWGGLFTLVTIDPDAKDPCYLHYYVVNLKLQSRDGVLATAAGDIVVPWQGPSPPNNEVHRMAPEAIILIAFLALVSLFLLRKQIASRLRRKSRLTVLANRLKSDKGDTYKHAHDYTRIYEVLFEPFLRVPNFNLLEIGLNQNRGNKDIPSLRLWRDHFGPEANIFGIDIEPYFLSAHDPSSKLWIGIGDQSSPEALQGVLASWRNPGFDVIIDDGYHHPKHQQVSLATLWDSVRPGGLYIIEDLHCTPKPRDGVIRTRTLLKAWQAGAKGDETFSEFVPNAAHIKAGIASISFFDSRSKCKDAQDALVVIRKKS